VKSPGEALEIAKRYWPQVPVRVFELATELGLGPVFDPALGEMVSGMIQRRPDGDFEIVVNARHHVNRQRFTVAHEIGHFIFHRDRLHAGTSDTLAYRTDQRIFPNSLIGPEQERQANNFAANLLIPNTHLQAAQAAGFTDPSDLAQKYEVSLGAMKIKLGLSGQMNLFQRSRHNEVQPEQDRYGFDLR
jgi:Zn-dependent peptidase ImmA (M78 family)